MNENIFFDLNRLKSVGKNVIIGKTVRIRYPELVEIGDNVIIDDFVYISTSLKIHSYVHISSGCKIIGGKHSFVEFKEFSTLSPSVILSNVVLNEGACIGALSLVKTNVEPWGLYAGIPVKKIKIREKDKIIKLEEDFWKKVKKGNGK